MPFKCGELHVSVGRGEYTCVFLVHHVPPTPPSHPSRQRSRPSSHDAPDRSPGLWLPPVTRGSEHGSCPQNGPFTTPCLGSVKWFLQKQERLTSLRHGVWSTDLEHKLVGENGTPTVSAFSGVFWVCSDSNETSVVFRLYGSYEPPNPRDRLFRSLRHRGDPGLLQHFTSVARSHRHHIPESALYE